MNFLKKIQNLSASKRKIILWVIITIIGLVLLTFWVKDFQIRLKNFKMEEFKIPPFGEEFKNLEIPH